MRTNFLIFKKKQESVPPFLTSTCALVKIRLILGVFKVFKNLTCIHILIISQEFQKYNQPLHINIPNSFRVYLSECLLSHVPAPPRIILTTQGFRTVFSGLVFKTFLLAIQESQFSQNYLLAYNFETVKIHLLIIKSIKNVIRKLEKLMITKS